MKANASYKLIIKDLKVDINIFLKILQIGLPAGIQGMLFSISNIIIQSSINYFGDLAMAGSTACQSLEGFVYTSMNGFSQGALTFCSQNMGAGKPERIKKLVWISQLSIVLISII